MQPGNAPHKPGTSHTDEEPPPLRAVIAYDDLAAGERAMRVIASAAGGVGNDLQFEPFPWAFDLLADNDWGAVAASEAVKADILVIATSALGPLPPAVGRWAEAAISRKRGSSAAVVALLGPEENPDGTGSSRLEAIQQAAHRAGLDFFAPTPPNEIGKALPRIPGRSERTPPGLPSRIEQMLQQELFAMCRTAGA